MKDKIKVVHPAYSICDEILFLGFSNKKFNRNYKKEMEEIEDSKNEKVTKRKPNKWINQKMHLAVQIDVNGKPIPKIISGDEAEINGTLYVFDADSDDRDRKLIHIDNRWSEELLRKSQYKNEVDKAGLYHTLYTQIKSYVFLEKESDYDLMLCWIIGTYFYQVFGAYPYIHLKGLKGSGKSTCLDFITLTAFNACKDSATYASMRDKIDGQRATFLTDQADHYFSERSESDMLNILVGSYRKTGGKVIKSVEIKRRHQNVDFDVYSPKGFASVRELHHDLRDRCIQFNFYKSPNNLQFLKDNSPVWLNIRNELYKLLICEFINVGKIDVELQAKYQDSGSIKNRPLELWLPIEAMMKLFNFEENKIHEIKKNFLSKIRNTQDGFSINENMIVEKVLNLIGSENTKQISLKEITKGLGLSTEEVDTGKNPHIYVANIIKKLNLISGKKRKNSGWNYFFEKSKVENIYHSDPENTIQNSPDESVQKVTE